MEGGDARMALEEGDHGGSPLPVRRVEAEDAGSGREEDPGRAAAPVVGQWGRAFEQWLAGKAPNTRRAYVRAWEDLLGFTGKGPAELRSGDLQAWADDLGGRALDATVLKGLQVKGRRPADDGNGLSAATMAQWISAVSSFYRYVSAEYLVAAPGGGEEPLHPYNPAAALRRPDVASYARADFLDSRALVRLLEAIPRRTVAGRRDYALFLGYILTGRRNGEWRELRWGDLRARGNRVYYAWHGKNREHARNELPPPVWEALRGYLEAAGRLEGMEAGDYLFTPLSDRAARLPNVEAAGWDRNRPLSAGTVNRLLKTHARRAGLDARRVHVHVLRHSAAMLEEELGTGLAQISRFLGHADPKTTMRYLEHLRGEPDGTWRQKAALLGLGDG